MTNYERTFGKYSISIGTSVALEGLFGVAEHQSNQAGAKPYHSYQGVVANFKTLVRNFLASFKSTDLLEIPVTHLYQTFLGELVLMGNIIEENSGGRLKLYVYYNTYEKLNRYLKKVTLKSKFTAKQAHLLSLETTLYEKVSANLTLVNAPFEFEETKCFIDSGNRHNVIVTHIPVDLILVKNNCDLLESHTGKIKTRRHFYSKLKNANPHVPFNKYTVQIFGDTAGTVMSMSSKIVAEVKKICESSGLTSVSGDLRFYKAMRNHGSTELKSVMSAMK